MRFRKKQEPMHPLSSSHPAQAVAHARRAAAERKSMTAREQAKESVRKNYVGSTDENSRIQAADIASDVWEQRYRELWQLAKKGQWYVMYLTVKETLGDF